MTGASQLVRTPGIKQQGINMVDVRGQLLQISG